MRPVGSLVDSDHCLVFHMSSSPPKAHLPTPDIEARRLLAVEAVRSRYTAQPARPESDPYLDVPTHQGQSGSNLFMNGNEDLEMQEALLDSIEAARAQTHPASPAPAVASGSHLAHYSPPPRPHVPVPNPRTAGDESDDSMEYVEPPSLASHSNRAPVTRIDPNVPVAQAAPGSDDSDAFEEVDVAPAVTRPPTAQRQPPCTRTPSDSAAPGRPSLIDTVFVSDSGSEQEESPRRRSPRPLPRSPPPKAPHEATPPAPDVTARDFGEEEFTVRRRARPDADDAPRRVSHDAAALLDLRFADTASKLDNFSSHVPVREESPTGSPSRPLRQSFPRASSPEPMSEQPTSPGTIGGLNRATKNYEKDTTRLLPPLRERPPLSEETSRVDKVSLPAPEPSGVTVPSRQTDEKRSPSPRKRSPSPTPWVQSSHASHRPASPRSRARTPPKDEDEAETQTQAIEERDEGREEPGDEEEEEDFLPWSRSPTPQPRAAAHVEGGSSSAATAPRSQDLIDAAIEQAATRGGDSIVEEEQTYSNVATTLRNEELETMREDATRDMARLLEQRNAEQRNADGITRQMASEIKVRSRVVFFFFLSFFEVQPPR